MRSATALLVILAVAAACATREQIVNPRVPRNPTVFESDNARETFEDALEERYDRGDARLGRSNKKLSLNAFFNQQVPLADGNADGIISDAEAYHYREDIERSDADEQSEGGD